MLSTPFHAKARATIRAGALLATTWVAACGSTSLVNMWKDPNFPRQPLGRVLVVTLRKDATSRKIWEDGYVASLRSRGVEATASYTLFPNAAPDTAALTGTVRSRGFDAVLVAHQLSSENQDHYVPGYLSAEPATYLSPWTGHYYTYFSQVYAPGYVESDHVVRYETEVWMTHGGGRVVWSGTTESINPTSAGQINEEITDVIVPALLKSGVVRAH